MRIIKVDAISSTNDFIRSYYGGENHFEPVCVVARHQNKGKGQRGGSWSVTPGKNLTFSVLYPEISIGASRQFLLSAVVALSVLNVLKRYEIPKLCVKWPNDIMAGRYKIGGILIENILKKADIAASIIGIGLNVNQVAFGELTQASSIKVQMGQEYDLEVLLMDLLDELSFQLKNLSTSKADHILTKYCSHLFRKDVVSTFRLPDGSFFSGIIKGVTPEGLLTVQAEEGGDLTFDLKEIKLMY